MESGSPTDLRSCTVKNLREELGRRGLSKKGTKPVLIERLEEALATESKAEEMESRSTSSQTSLLSSCSISSLRAQEAAKKAELKAKAALLEEKERLLREEMELKMRKERLQLQEEIALTEAREQALASSEQIPSDICPPQAQNPVTCGRDDSLTQREDMTAIQALLTRVVLDSFFRDDSTLTHMTIQVTHLRLNSNPKFANLTQLRLHSKPKFTF